MKKKTIYLGKYHIHQINNRGFFIKIENTRFGTSLPLINLI